MNYVMPGCGGHVCMTSNKYDVFEGCIKSLIRGRGGR